tara:strand:+ start:3329 stop:4576 length:1248 start_codon:yes stop_codon:yes gene_type:complete
MARLSTSGLELIKKFEGLSLESYICPSGVLTIGYGHTGSDVFDGKKITEEEAETLLKKDVTTYELAVNNLTTTKLNQNEYDALVSFTYNVGVNAYKYSTLLNKLNGGISRKEVAYEFGRWTKGAEGTDLPGLIRRRAEEKKLFLTKPEKHPMLGRSILARQDTWLKTRPTQSTDLLPEEKLFVPKGAAWEWDRITMYSNAAHYEVRLSAQTDKNWYFYSPHWKIINDLPDGTVTRKKNNEIKLQVPYYSQRDNYREANRTCFSSACAMLLSGLKPDVISNDDEYLQTVCEIGDTTEAWVQVRALMQYGIETEFKQDGDWSDVEELLEKNIPVPLGILHHGGIENPTGGGHWVCAVGLSADKSKILVHDPFGDLDLITGRYINGNGEYLFYSKKNLGPRWMVEKGYSSGWFIKAKK